MLVEVRVPQLSESVAEATLLTWHKKPGEFVQRDENLIDIETDKVVLELPAPESGVLAKIVKPDGGTVVSNEVIATIDTEAKAAAVAPAKAAVAAVVKPTPARAPEAPASKAPASKEMEPPVMPAARKLAAEKGVDLSVVPGTGRGGR
ncbi:MAG TPA: biotin/lipoyl-containing protein, partial [Burkholderiales bacterium]|nr:biotin/lipoyl-containing protein [Burkholderiales bacterium]